MVKEFISDNDFAGNVFLVKNNHEALLIDAGSYSHKLKNELENYSLLAILLTHGHFDHIKKVDEILSEHKNVIFYCGEEKDFLLNPKKNGSQDFNCPISIKHEFIELEEKILNISSFTIYCYHLKGHTEGSFVFYIPQEKAIFFGDTILGSSIGRYDLYSGSYFKLKESLKRIKFLPFKDDDICYFGHSEMMTFKKLKECNMYI